MEIHIHIHHHTPDIRDVVVAVKNLEQKVMASKAQVLEQLVAANAGLEKLGNETGALVTEVAALKAQIAEQGDSVPEEIATAVASLAERIRVVDDMVPDPVPAGDLPPTE